MSRRRHGNGGVRRREDGRWEGTLRLADCSRKYVYAGNRDLLIAKLQEERWRLAYGIPIRSKGLLVGDYLAQWLEVMRSRLRPKTFDAYELCVHRIDALLGSFPLARLTPQSIQRSYGELLVRGLSPRTVFHTHAVLHRALKRARHWGLISSVPSELVAPPRAPYREMTTLSAVELEHLFETSRGNRWHPLWVVLGTVGLRIGEALGLKWTDVDFATGRVQIRRALQRQRRRGLVFVEPKSKSSRRCINLSDVTLAALRKQKRQSDGELVFPNCLGEPQESSSVTSALKVAIRAAGVPMIRVHDLRHTCATILLEAGVHPKLVQDLLGHSSVALTLNTYSHVTSGLSRETARTMDRIFARAMLKAS